MHSQQWHHFGKQTEIGNTTYWWGGYVSYQEQGKEKVGYIVADEEMAPLRHMTKLAEELSDNKQYKLALSDAANGSSALVKSEKLAEKEVAYGHNEFDTHLTPAAILVK